MSYREEFKELHSRDLPWEKLQDSHILLTGATGMIGLYLVCFLCYLNEAASLNLRMTVVCRNPEKTRTAFGRKNLDVSRIDFLEADLTVPFSVHDDSVDYVLHCGGLNHPAAFAKQPVETVKASVLGTMSLLDSFAENGLKGFVLLSTGEIYGEQMHSHEEGCDESVAGMVETMRPRACYPEGKRAAETLVCGYAQEYGIRAMAARLGYVYGPTMMQDSSKADITFFLAAQAGKDIVLKSTGQQLRSYMYVEDAVYGILAVLLLGNAGEAYNVANPDSICTIAELAGEIARQGNVQVLFDIPEDVKKDEILRGGSAMKREILRTEKLEALGYRPFVSLKDGVTRTFALMNC